MAMPKSTKSSDAKAKGSAAAVKKAAKPSTATAKSTHKKFGAGNDTKPAKSGTKADLVQDDGSLEALRAKLEEGTAWYDILEPLQAPEPSAKKSKKSKKKQAAETEELTAESPAVQKAKARGQALLEQEVSQHERKKEGSLSSDDKYLATMMRSGTLSDRVAALTLSVQASPILSLSKLSQLTTMAGKKARRESRLAVESLRDLFINNLLPTDRKLSFFHQQPLSHPDISDAYLLIWFFEHCLKTAYANLVGVLSSGLEDAVAAHKKGCLHAAATLLTERPEQEAVLLSMLVNKLGDPDRKIAASVQTALKQLLTAHPAMKKVVADDVERLVTRPHVADRSKYNAILFLNQLQLTHEDADLASHLITVYFGLFSKEIAGLQKAPTPNRKKKSVMKKQKKGKKMKDENPLDRKLLSALLMGVNRAFPFTDATSASLTKEIESLFSVVHKAPFATGIQALLLLFQVLSSTHSVSDRFYVALYAKLMDPRLRQTSKHTVLLNLVYRAIKNDVSPARSAAFIKRLLQLSLAMNPAFSCAVLYLVSELFKVQPQLRTLLDQPSSEVFESTASEMKADTNEHSDSEDDEVVKKDQEQSQAVLAQMFGSSDTTETSGERKSVATVYDPMKRNPLFAGAERTCAWEVRSLLTHYHPSVRVFTKQLVLDKETGIQYDSDPLIDFSVPSFFEKFVTKKPKPTGTKQTSTSSAPTTLADMGARETVSTEDDAFFHRFFQERSNREQQHKSLRKKKKSVLDETDSGPQDADVFSDNEDGEDEEMEAFAQQLAEGMMEDADNDDEDPDTGDWSGPESDDDEADAEDMEEPEMDDMEEPEFDGADDDSDDEELMEFGEDEDEEEEAEEEEEEKPAKKDGKRKSPFASADDYEEMVKKAMEAREAKADSAPSKKKRKKQK